ncbi:hypothetical protein KDI_20430 [Dictyobacter arantiisoli]|uniref:Uncharacterized protein n=1 Tax=Dictyobacter arantiisoli TaxID=2014874 RepID=A0A5A5TBU8_9CHLR|nr:hypothetical protein KDI_20430 [Dictyobacter arantiisoli]
MVGHILTSGVKEAQVEDASLLALADFKTENKRHSGLRIDGGGLRRLEHTMLFK